MALLIEAGGKYLNTKEELMMKWQSVVVLMILSLLLNGCFLTKIVSVPMRVGGAVVSIIPVAGNTAHDVIDEAADIVDEVPL